MSLNNINQHSSDKKNRNQQVFFWETNKLIHELLQKMYKKKVKG